MARTGQDAIDYARGRVGPNAMPASGYCLQFVRECFGVGSYYASAIDAWNGSQTQHPGDRNPPPAVPMYFTSPSQYDHVVFWAGGDEIETTFNADVRQYVGNAISRIESDFDGHYLGWCEDINGVTVYAPTGAGEDLDMTPDEVRSIVQQEATNALRAEGVSGAATWSLGQYANGGYTVGSQAQKIIRDTTGELLTINGIVGAADGNQEWAQKYVRAIVAEETAKVVNGASATSASSRAFGLLALALVVLIAVVGGVAVGLLAGTQEGVIAGVATIVGGLLSVVLRSLPARAAS
jgi:hypothetical protein